MAKTPSLPASLADIGEASSDPELVRRMSQGDTQALAELYERHAPRLCALARRFLGPEEAEDLLHDVFLEAWRHAAAYVEARGSVWAWLCVRIRSRAIDRRRAAPRSLSLEPGGSGPTELAVAPPDADWASDFSRLRKALAFMSSDEREVLVLGYFDGLSSREIAARLGVPVGTVKSRTRGALAKLRKRLSPTRGVG